MFGKEPFIVSRDAHAVLLCRCIYIPDLDIVRWGAGLNAMLETIHLLSIRSHYMHNTMINTIKSVSCYCFITRINLISVNSSKQKLS